MNIAIVEDEPLAARSLQGKILSFDPAIRIVAMLESVKDAVEFFRESKPDLVFMDIRLSDGLCFEIFKQTAVSCPVVFTTAYDQYAIRAFDVNGIDYLLKPLSSESVERAFSRYEAMKELFSPAKFREDLLRFSAGTKQFKTRFLVKLGHRLIPVVSDEIAWFFAEDKWTYLTTTQNNRYIVDYTLTELENLLDPEIFFRINRQYTVHRKSLLSLQNYLRGQVLAKVKFLEDETVVVSRKVTPELKKWMAGEK